MLGVNRRNSARSGAFAYAVSVTCLWICCAGCTRASGSNFREANATPSPVSIDMHFDELARLVTINNVRSIEQLLPLLPEVIRSHHALLYESRSAQGATYESPRVILFRPDATFIMAYGGDRNLPGYFSLETIAWDDRNRVFCFREVLFPREITSDEPVSFSAPNPPKCGRCHGAKPRPLWDTYPAWPGAYGEVEHARPEADEMAGLTAFLAAREKSARYRSLISAGSRRELFPEEDRTFYNGKEALSQNAQLGLALQNLVCRAIASDVIASPRFPPFRYAILASLDPQCLAIDAFVPERIRALFAEKLGQFESETVRANATQAEEKRRRTRSHAAPQPVAQPETLTAFRYLVEQGLGLPTRAFTLALEKGTYDFTSPRPVTKVLEREIFDAVAHADPAIRSAYGATDHRDVYCALLRRRSLAELGGASR